MYLRLVFFSKIFIIIDLRVYQKVLIVFLRFLLLNSSPFTKITNLTKNESLKLVLEARAFKLSFLANFANFQVTIKHN